MKKNSKVTLPFTHLPRKGRQRKFKGQILKQSRDYSLILPDRQFFVQLVRFAPGKGPRDWVAFHKNMNRRRHEMDIHEIATFLTWGRWDMVVIWDSPDVETYNKFLASWINPNGKSPTSSDTLVAASSLTHSAL